MAKKVTAIVKLQCPAGQANPSPPVGPALGQHGVNIMEFCKAFNARTQDKQGLIIPAVITVYSDRTFTFELRTPPATAAQDRPTGRRLIPYSSLGDGFTPDAACASKVARAAATRCSYRIAHSQTPHRASASSMPSGVSS